MQLVNMKIWINLLKYLSQQKFFNYKIRIF